MWLLSKEYKDRKSGEDGEECDETEGENDFIGSPAAKAAMLAEQQVPPV